MLIHMMMPLAAMLAAAADTGPPTPQWTIAESTTALNDAPLVTATLPSKDPVLNMIGQPDNAHLILRCRDNVLAAYISWPQVLSQAGSTFSGRAQAMVLWRLNDEPIAVNFWLRSDDGTAVGMFDTKASVKLLSRVLVAKRMVVRLTGTTTQDAVFELGDIASTAKKVSAPCGVNWTIPTP